MNAALSRCHSNTPVLRMTLHFVNEERGLRESRHYPASSTERGSSKKLCIKIWCRRKCGSSGKAVLSPGERGLRTKVGLCLCRLALNRHEHSAASALDWVLDSYDEHGAGLVTLLGGDGYGCRLNALLTATAELAHSWLSVDNMPVHSRKCSH